jgi:predicted RNA-binding protein with PUA-like domain
MWLVKTEPGEYSFARLVEERRGAWDGVTNPAAQKNLRAMQVGEKVFVYHTGDDKAVVGVATVVGAARPDPKYPNGKLVVVDLEAVSPLGRPVTLAELKALPLFADSPLVRQGRLSVVPLTPPQVKAIEELGRR